MSSRRRGGGVSALIIAAIVVVVGAIAGQSLESQIQKPADLPTPTGDAAERLSTLPIKGRAPKTGYERIQFGDGWTREGDCDTRNRILARDLQNAVLDDNCKVLSGSLIDPYTGRSIDFTRGQYTSDDVQIDHVVALSNAWQTGAQQLSVDRRIQFANDPLELLAVAGATNQQKADGDAATWLPVNTSFRCSYIARQIAVKVKYGLWVTQAEHDAMLRVLTTCPGQRLPGE